MQQSAGRAQIVNIPAPVMGWNTRDSVDQMGEMYATELTNWFPGNGALQIREGYTDFVATGLGSAAVETLANIVTGSTEYFIACTDNKVYEVQSGTATDRTGAATITSDRWEWTVFADSTASNSPKILAVNGTDTPFQYGGGGNIAAWSPTGPTAANLAWVNGFKNRVFAGEKDSRDFWYGALGAIPGSMTKFPLSGVRGAQGNILFMASMTRDAGNGPDDYAVFVTDEGSVIVYQGTDPSSADTWSIVGVYRIPRPVSSRRAWAQIFGDVVIATEADYIFLSESLQKGGSVVLTPSLLAGEMPEVTGRYRANFGWQIVASPEQNVLLSNVPKVTGSQHDQHVWNLQTRAPAKFTGWPFSCFGVFNGRLYGGGVGAVYECLSGNSDDASGAETPIQARARTAWQHFGAAEQKRIHAIRPFFKTANRVDISASLGSEFIEAPHAATTSTGTSTATTLWGDTSGVTTRWGDTASTTTYWSGVAFGTLNTQREWQTVSARGTSFQLGLAVDVVDHRIQWLGTDYKVSKERGF
jgi:hypothetical protein